MKRILTLISLVSVLLLSSCRQKEEPQKAQPAQPAQPAQMQEHPGMAAAPSTPAQGHTVVIQEVIQASTYTYLNVKEGDKTFWMAISKKELNVGQTISFTGEIEQKNLYSKELDRTFESILFVGQINDGSTPAAPAAHAPAGNMMHSTKPTLEKKEITIEPIAGGITIQDIYANRATHANKTVLVKGQVTKVNRAIMGYNWVHLQDGTSDGDEFDLTITTKDDAKVGEVAAFQGKIALKKDFGAGYAYDVIMQDAKLFGDNASTELPSTAPDPNK